MSKHIQKTIQHQWKIEVREHQNRGQEVSWKGLGHIFRVLSARTAFWEPSRVEKVANITPT